MSDYVPCETDDRTKDKEEIGKYYPHIVPFKRSDLKRHTILSFKSEKINQRKFVNVLNFHNFVGNHIYVHALHVPLNEGFLIRVCPSPCMGNEVVFTLPDQNLLAFDNFSLQDLVIDNGKTVTLMHMDVVHVSARSFTAVLGQSGTVYHSRKERRFPCRMVDAAIRVGETVYNGMLDEFTASSLRISLKDKTWRESDVAASPGSITVELSREDEILFSGPSRLIRTEKQAQTVVLAPMNIRQKKYNERKFRNTRLTLAPAPQAVFDHPFTGERSTYDICDITTSGFSVFVETDFSLIIPGMILPELQVIFAGGLSLACSAQVIYLKKQRGNITRVGFLITDMDPVTYTRLFNILTRADDPHSLASSKVPIDALWEFFFRSGFIYPEKYLCISRNKKHFKDTYQTLYHDCPEIFSSLTYQRNDQIYGHVSIVKAYPFAWMVQHLAALPMGSKRTGLFILKQMLNYLDGFHRMPSIAMKYLVFNYRPDNKFPNYFFGGVCNILNAPYMCSVDEFAYLSHRMTNRETTLPAGWSIRTCDSEDIAALHGAYHRHSEGLMIETFGLEADDQTLWETYEKLGLMRKCRSYALTRNNERVCFFVVDQSDQGLNMSDLLNSIKVIIPRPDPQYLPWHTVLAALSHIGKEYGTPDVVLQVFPSSYLDTAGVRYPKKYCMWIAKTSYFDPYYDAIRKMTHFSVIKYLKSTVETKLGLRK